MKRTTTFDSAVAHFTRSKSAARELERWSALPGKEPVVDFARRLVSERVYEVTPEHVEDVCSRTTHALTLPGGRGLRRSVAESVAEIADWYPNFPFVHSLYYAVEALHGPPTWEEFIEFWRNDPDARTMLGIPARRAVSEAIDSGHTRAAAEEAMWWRLGNAYYSLLRELYVLSVLRACGFAVEYHVIADALFRADFWVGDVVISLYVANDRYRAGGEGRKPHPRAVLGDFNGFRFVEMPRLTRHEYGTVHLPSRQEIEQFAERQLANS